MCVIRCTPISLSSSLERWVFSGGLEKEEGIILAAAAEEGEEAASE